MTELVGFPCPARLTRDDTKKAVQFHYNPASVVIKATATWHQESRKSPKGPADPEYIGSDPKSMTLSAMFDQVEDPRRSVATDVEELLSWTRATEASHKTNTPQPPMVLLGWGVGKYFEGYLASVQATYSLFAPDGTPLRASVDLTINELPETTKRQNPTSGGPSGRRRATAVRGDTLQSLAQQEYGDPNLWRAIAVANDIDEPLRLAPGTELLLPSVNDANAVNTNRLAGSRRG
jgi:hypothetical protein